MLLHQHPARWFYRPLQHPSKRFYSPHKRRPGSAGQGLYREANVKTLPYRRRCQIAHELPRTFETKVRKAGVQGAAAPWRGLRGSQFWQAPGVPNNSFFLFFAPPAATRGGEKKFRGDTPRPAKGGCPLQSRFSSSLRGIERQFKIRGHSCSSSPLSPYLQYLSLQR